MPEREPKFSKSEISPYGGSPEEGEKKPGEAVETDKEAREMTEKGEAKSEQEALEKREGKEEEWQPEEDKDWPQYIKRRFEALNAAHSLDYSQLKKLLKQDSDSFDINPLFYLAQRYQQLKEAGRQELLPVDQSLVNIIIKEAKNQNSSICLEAIKALGNLGEPALEILKILTEDKEGYVRLEAAKALGNLGETKLALEILKTLTEDKSVYVRVEAIKARVEAIERARDKIQIQAKLKSQADKQALIRSLISRQEPVLANPLVENIYQPTKEAESPLLKLTDIIQGLKARYPNLLGLSVLGSLSKGYFISGSDLDWGLIYFDSKETSQMIDDFKSEAESAGFCLCADHSINLSRLKNEDPTRLEIVFNGLFFGDRQKLKQAQSAIVALGPNTWQEIQKVWEDAMENYSKLSARFDLSEDEVKKIKFLRHYLWHLPDFKTAKKEYA